MPSIPLPYFVVISKFLVSNYNAGRPNVQSLPCVSAINNYIVLLYSPVIVDM